MGPMYHVLDADDRQRILKEAMRILKKDGVAIIAYLNSWGILKTGVTESGFELLSYAGAEGYLSGIQTEITRLYKETRGIYDNFVKVAAESCECPQYRDATKHLHLVVKKK